MRTIAITTLTAFLALYLGLECGYRIGHNSALKTQARAIQQALKVSKLTGAPFYQVLTGVKP